MCFHVLTFAGSRGCCLNTRPIGRVIKHLPRDPASVNAMKQTCMIVILADFTLFQQIRSENAAKTLNCTSSYTGFLKQNGVGCVLSSVITSSRCHNRTQRFREQKHRRNDQPGPQCFLYLASCK